MVRGRGQLDFKTGTVHLRLMPQPKTARFFTFSAGVEAKGPFNNISFGVPKGELLGGLVSFFTSPFHVLMRRLGKALEGAPKKNPCIRALEGDPES